MGSVTVLHDAKSREGVTYQAILVHTWEIYLAFKLDQRGEIYALVSPHISTTGQEGVVNA